MFMGQWLRNAVKPECMSAQTLRALARAALSAGHLAALLLPPTLRRLYIARDADAAGDNAFAMLSARATAAGIEVLALSPQRGDFNDDLQARGVNALRAALRPQLAPQDTERAGAVA